MITPKAVPDGGLRLDGEQEGRTSQAAEVLYTKGSTPGPGMVQVTPDVSNGPPDGAEENSQVMGAGHVDEQAG